jgi:putative Mg2+ transporter-C (MgtC) family protein
MDVVAESFTTATSEWTRPLARLGVAAIAGGVVGWEREVRGRPAGLRTHMLVSLGAALVMSTLDEASADAQSRVIQGIATGVGFVCAGEILHKVRPGGEKVTGLTSAASLWVTAALGIAAGAGRWPLVALGTFLTLLTLTMLSGVEKSVRPAKHSHDGAEDEPPKG